MFRRITHRAAVARWPAARITLRQDAAWCIIPDLPTCVRVGTAEAALRGRT
jgi:hypothetical protein